MTPETLAILANPEVLAVDQDALGIQGRRVSQESPLEVWAKPLAEGCRAAGPFNRGEAAMPTTLKFRGIGLGDTASVRDLWTRKDLGIFRASFTTEVPQHGVALIRVK